MESYDKVREGRHKLKAHSHYNSFIICMVANSPVTLLVFVLVIGLVSCLTPIGLDPIQPYQLSKGQITTYQFSYIPSSEILKNAALRVTFPKEFDYAEVAARL